MPHTGALALASDHIAEVANADASIPDLEREVYCVLGMPIDAVDMTATLRKINRASLERKPFLISTANLNFLANSSADAEFRESLLLSDLCTADGMPIVWLARLLGLPINQRVAGADILDQLRSPTSCRKLCIFFFGGADGIAEAARRMLNADKSGLTCVGTLNPGFCTTEEMSSDATIAAINASN